MTTKIQLSAVFLCLVANSVILTQKLEFKGGIKYDQTCGLRPSDNWTADGRLVLTKQDLLMFQQKVIIQTVSELCSIDLKQCPPSTIPKSPDACFCQEMDGDKYVLHIGSRARPEQDGLDVQALVPAQLPFKHVIGFAKIGKIPELTDDSQRVNATYTFDDGVSQDLKPYQNVSLCPNKLVGITICTKESQPSTLKLTVNRQVTATTDSCVLSYFKVTSNPATTNVIKFEYKDQSSCPHTDTSLINIEVSEKSCVRPTTAKTPTPTPTTTQTPTPTPTPTTQAPSLDWSEGCADDGSSSDVTKLSNGMTAVCNRKTDGGKWVVIQRRTSADEDFYRNWADYVQGFGSLSGNFWYGLDKIHQLCPQSNSCQLRIDLKYSGKPNRQDLNEMTSGFYYAKYDNFGITDEEENFKLSINGYTGTAGDSLTRHHGMFFTTKDKDHDTHGYRNCADYAHGAFWYWACSNANLNGKWGSTGKTAVEWASLAGTNSVTFTEMKVRSVIN